MDSYSGFVQVAKVMLPVAAVGLIALVILWPHLRTEDLRFRIGFAGFFGLGLIALLLWRIGLDEVTKHIVRIGWLAPLVLFPQALVALFDAKGWDYTFSLSGSQRSFSLLRLSLIRLAGEAVNNLTPTANVGGEGWRFGPGTAAFQNTVHRSSSSGGGGCVGGAVARNCW